MLSGTGFKKFIFDHGHPGCLALPATRAPAAGKRPGRGVQSPRFQPQCPISNEVSPAHMAPFMYGLSAA